VKPLANWDPAQLQQEITSGAKSVIAVDDTAGPNLPGLHPQRKAHAAIVVPKDRAIATLTRMTGLRNELIESSGVDQFHFKDLFHGQGPYSRLAKDITARLYFVSQFVALFNDLELPIFVCQTDPDELAARKGSHPIFDAAPKQMSKGGALSLRSLDLQTFTLVGAVMAAVGWLEPRTELLPATAYMDRIRGDEPVNLALLNRDRELGLSHVLDPATVIGDLAANNPFLMLADFAAWSFTRLEGYAAKVPLADEWSQTVNMHLLPVLGNYEIDPGFPSELHKQPQPGWSLRDAESLGAAREASRSESGQQAPVQ
jgi:hypothetical protein